MWGLVAEALTGGVPAGACGSRGAGDVRQHLLERLGEVVHRRVREGGSVTPAQHQQPSIRCRFEGLGFRGEGLGLR